MLAPIDRPKSAAHPPITPWGLRKASFQEIDRDGNGSLSRDEFVSRVKVGRNGGPGDTFDQLDGDRDGQVGPGEWSTLTFQADRSRMSPLARIGYDLAMPFLHVGDLVYRMVMHPRETFTRDFKS